jgi:acyl-coenzyme A thioesterase PaaI-like protein
MARQYAAPGNVIRSWWDRLSPRPGGRYAFDLLIGRIVPYTGTIHPRVLELGAGHARVAMRERRRVRNHLASVHAIALANLAEITGGLAMAYALPPEARGIVLGLEMEYLKKARGSLLAAADFEPPHPAPKQEYTLDVDVRDGAGDIVARGRVRWLLEWRGA